MKPHNDTAAIASGRAASTAWDAGVAPTATGVRARSRFTARQPLARLVLWLLVIAGLAAAGVAGAQDKPNREREMLRRLQQSLSQAQAAQSAAESEKAELAAKLAAAESELKGYRDTGGSLKKKAQSMALELEAARRDASGYRGRALQYEKALDEMREQAKTTIAEVVKTANDRITQSQDDNAALREKLTKLQQQNQELDRTVQGLNAEGRNLKTDLAARADLLKTCENKNTELLTLNKEIRQRYADKGFFSMLRKAEPLTGLGSVREENALQDLEDRAEANRAIPATR